MRGQRLRRLAGVNEPPKGGDWEPAAEILSRVLCGEGSIPIAEVRGQRWEPDCGGERSEVRLQRWEPEPQWER